MCGPRDNWTKRGKSDRKRQYHVISLICGLLKNDTELNLFTKLEIESWMWKTNMVTREGKGAADKLGDRD